MDNGYVIVWVPSYGKDEYQMLDESNCFLRSCQDHSITK